MVEELGRLAEGMASLEGGQVGVPDLLLVGELGPDPPQRVVDRPGVHPRHEAEGEEVLGALSIARLHPEGLDGAKGEARHRHLEDGVALEASVLEGIGGVARLGEVAGLEGIDVDDDAAARLQARQLVAQRGRVHGHQDVGRIAGGGDVVVGDVDLEGGDAGQRARRRPDLGRKVRHGGQVVAEHGAGAREPIAGELHPVA